jgi:hypothetical protein
MPTRTWPAVLEGEFPGGADGEQQQSLRDEQNGVADSQPCRFGGVQALEHHAKPDPQPAEQDRDRAAGGQRRRDQ